MHLPEVWQHTEMLRPMMPLAEGRSSVGASHTISGSSSGMDEPAQTPLTHLLAFARTEISYVHTNGASLPAPTQLSCSSAEASDVHDAECMTSVHSLLTSIRGSAVLTQVALGRSTGAVSLQ